MDSRASSLRLVRPDAAASPSASDDYLMSLVAAGQEQAFSELVRRYQPRVERFCQLLLGDSQAAADAAQEIFCKLWERRLQYRPQNRLRELLFMMARNHCRSLGRRKWLKALVSIEDSVQAQNLEGPRFDQTVERTEQQLIVAAALAKLPEKFRIPLALRFLEEMPYEEIAQIIGRTPSAARSRIHYGLRELASLLPDEVVTP
jgi:RNA polymerase sigma-70 factor, ECF subfamily